MRHKPGSPLRHRSSQPNGFPKTSRNDTGISHQLGINRHLTLCGYICWINTTKALITAARFTE
jgi:hypothetical protein